MTLALIILACAIDAVQKAQRAYASAVTRANRAHQRAASAAFSFFGAV